MKNIFLLVAFVSFSTIAISQANFTAVLGSKLWGNAANWTLDSGSDADGIPDADDNVTIGDGSTMRVSNTTVACNNLTIDCNINFTTNNASLVLIGSGVVNVGGNVTLTDDWADDAALDAVINLVGSTSHLNVTGNIDFQAFSNDACKLLMSSTSGTVQLGGDFTFSFGTEGTITGGSNGSTIDFAGAAAQTIPAQYATMQFCNITNNNTHASGLTPDAALTNANFTGSLTNNQVFNDGGFAIALAGSVTNSGTYNATSSLDIAGNFTNTGTFTSTGCNINLEGNWDNTGGTYTYATGDIVSFDGTGGTAATVVGNTGWYELNCNHVTGLTISDAQDIYGILDIDQGTFDALTNSPTVTLISNATRTAQMDNVGTGSYSGNITVQRYISKTAQGYVSIGCPVSGNTLNNYHDGGIAAGQEFILAGYTGADYWTDGTWINTYTYNCLNVSTSRSEGWVSATNTTNTIGVDNGYKAEYIYADAATYNISFTGAPSTGAVGITLNYLNAGDPLESGWNFITNPYPCTVDWQTVRTGITNMVDGYMIYAADAGNFAYWDGASATGTNGGTQYVPSSQGFWVRATASTTLNFAETDKVAAQDPTFVKSSSPNNTMRIHMSGNVNQFSDEAIILADNIYSSDFENTDISKLISPDSTVAPTLMTYSSDGAELAINKISDTKSIDIPITAKAGTSAQGTYQLDFSLPADFMDGACVTLEDLSTGTITDLRVDTSYSFASSDTNQLPRFVLHITRGVELSVTDLTCAGNVDGKISLAGSGISGHTFTLTDDIGTQVFNGVAANDSITISNLPAGVYSLTSTYVNGCSATNTTVTIVEPAAIVADFSFVNDTLYLSQGDVMEISNNSVGTGYLWDFGDGITSTDPNPTHTYASPGIYQVMLTVSNDGVCTEITSQNIVVMAAPLSIENNIQEADINAFVTNEKLLVQFNFSTNTNVSVTLTDVSGKIIVNENVRNASNNQIELTQTDLLSKGVYFVTVFADNNKIVKKISID